MKDLYGARIFLSEVDDPKKYGVAILASNKRKIKRIFEKPKNNRSNLAITGIYFFDKNLSEHIKNLKISSRGELEITDVLKSYHKKADLEFDILDRGVIWIDAGTTRNIIRASQIINIIENRTKFKIACLEEIALEKKYINLKQLKRLIKEIPDCEYKNYLENIIKKNG